MKKKILSALLLLTLFFAGHVSAQNLQVMAKMDSTNILIGDQTVIHFELTQDKNQIVSFPLLTDTIVKGIEILDINKPDTVVLSDNRISIKQDVLITSFDSALYYIPPFRFIAGSDTVYTNPLALNVQTFEVDLESKELFDIKTIKKAPFVFMDYFWPVFIPLILIIVFALAIWYYLKWKKNRTNPENNIPAELLIPAADAARISLEELKEKKLWQQGLEKEYYSSLTDILRVYIERRFLIGAMEMTSAEIIDSLKNKELDKSVLFSLKDLMQVSDFVKFAKLKPTYEENESSIIIAESFIDKTEEKQKETEESEPQVTVENDNANDLLDRDIIKDDQDSDHDKYMPKS